MSGKRTYFDRPEVTGEQEDDCHHTGNETTAEELTKQIREDGGNSEEEVKERGHRVSADWLNEAHFSYRVNILFIIQK